MSLPTIRTTFTLMRLLPSLLALRRDRKEWTTKDAKTIDRERYRRNARRMLNVFLSLGPVYIKLGQWLSSRADILPQPYMQELAKLQDDVPAAPFQKVLPIVREELGDLYDEIDEIRQDALSGASLGQVYRGRIGDQEIVIKVKRPGIEDLITRDLEVIKKILPIGLRLVDRSLRISARAMMTQFVETINEELDYTTESENLRRIRRNMQDNGSVIIPAIFEKYTTGSVLVMEYIPGIKITDIESLDKKGIDRRKLVVDVHKIFFSMLLRHTIFHADPHPGNISVADDGRLILYDYGMVGRLDNDTRKRLIRLYLALVEKEPARMVRAMDSLGMLAPNYNYALIKKSIELGIEAMHGKKPDQMQIQGLMELANRTMGQFPFILPKNLALYMRMASIIEGIYKTHMVEFKFVKVLAEILRGEELIQTAYIDELKLSFERIVQSVDAAISIAPEVKRLLDENQLAAPSRSARSGIFLPCSILGSAIFVGSAVLYTSNEVAGAAGMISSAIIAAIGAIFRGS